MTVVLPEPVRLDPPPGDPAAVADAFRSAAAAAARLAPLGDGVAAAQESVPHWHGMDALAAAAAISGVATFARSTAPAVLRAAAGLSSHAHLLEEIRRQVGRLVAEQEEDFRSAWRRLAHIDGIGLSAGASPEVQGIVEDLTSSEHVRRSRHAALLDEVRADAVATARILAECSAAVGGAGRRNESGRVAAHLAAALPEWGRQELAALGRTLAQSFLGPITPEQLESRAREAADYVGTEAFADSFLATAGSKGVHYLLMLLGDNLLGPTGGVAALLAATFGAATPEGLPGGAVSDVLSAVYVRPGDAESGVVVAGMAAVLAAWLAGGAAPLETVAGWGRQILLRDRAQGAPAGLSPLPRAAPAVGDPAEMVLELLARGGAAAPAAALLADRGVWRALLSRRWGLPGDLADVVTLAGAEPGAAGDAVVRSGLGALADGLADDGDPDGWTVDRQTAAAISAALGGAVVAHLTVATRALADGADAWITTATGDVLRGLGYLTLDAAVAADLEGALAAWASAQPLPSAFPAAPAVVPALAVPGAFVAVREYGQRLAHALDGYEREAAAENSALWWNLTVGLATAGVGGKFNPVVSVISGYAARAVGADGTWENGPDLGLRFDRADAISAARAALPPATARAVDALARQAATAYAGTAYALGRPTPPTSPEWHWWDPLVDALAPGPTDGPEVFRKLRTGQLDGGVLGPMLFGEP